MGEHPAYPTSGGSPAGDRVGLRGTGGPVGHGTGPRPRTTAAAGHADEHEDGARCRANRRPGTRGPRTRRARPPSAARGSRSRRPGRARPDVRSPLPGLARSGTGASPWVLPAVRSRARTVGVRVASRVAPPSRSGDWPRSVRPPAGRRPSGRAGGLQFTARIIAPSALSRQNAKHAVHISRNGAAAGRLPAAAARRLRHRPSRRPPGRLPSGASALSRRLDGRSSPSGPRPDLPCAGTGGTACRGSRRGPGRRRG